jgi:NodT family efflux transporter outer membrane factor (OMF) lipoprotein
MSFFRLPRRAAAQARIAGLVSVLALMSACAPDLGPMAKMKPADNYAASKTLGAPTAAAWPGLDWWTAYNDPQLTALIEEALKGSPDLRVAQARLKQAIAMDEQASAVLYPTVNTKGSLDATAVSINAKGVPQSFKNFLPQNVQYFPQVSASLDYQIDFFGKNRAAVAAASSQAKAAEFELAAARLQISTNVASAYADLVRLTADRQAAQEAVRVRGDSLTLVSDRLKNGLENQSQLAESSALSNVSLGDVAALDQAIEAKRHELAALVGAGPDRGIDITVNTASAVKEPYSLPSNLTADLIGRRPDIAAARLRALAAADKIKVAHADFYPNVSLTGTFLGLSLTPDQLLNHGIYLGQFGPAVSLPIFEGGRLKGAYRNANGQYEEAVANYDKAVAQALREVADAISARKHLADQIVYAQKATADSQKSFDLATMRYKGGLSPYLTVLTAESTLVTQNRAAADLQAQALVANIALVRALGGGFTEDTTSSSKGHSHG